MLASDLLAYSFLYLQRKVDVCRLEILVRRFIEISLCNLNLLRQDISVGTTFYEKHCSRVGYDSFNKWTKLSFSHTYKNRLHNF